MPSLPFVVLVLLMESFVTPRPKADNVLSAELTTASAIVAPNLSHRLPFSHAVRRSTDPVPRPWELGIFTHLRIKGSVTGYAASYKANRQTTGAFRSGTGLDPAPGHTSVPCGHQRPGHPNSDLILRDQIRDWLRV